MINCEVLALADEQRISKETAALLAKLRTDSYSLPFLLPDDDDPELAAVYESFA